MAQSRKPYVISLNCLEHATQEMAAALSDLCVLEHVGLVEGMLEKVGQAAVVILPSIQYLPRAAQRKLAPTQLLLCVGAGADMRAVESSVAEELGLRLCHVDVPRADEVADTVMALLLGLMRKSHTLATQGCTSASWHGGFRDAWAGMRRLRGLTLGLVGVNAVGRAVARRAAAFGMKVVYCDLESELLGADVAEAKRKGKVRKALQAVGKGMMTLRQTVEHADIVSLHCSLKDDTLHLINDKTISYFKKGTVLVNASSCHLVSDAALKRALQSGLLSCCALDGVEGPQWMEAWVREFPNVLILPRSADQSAEVWAELSQKVVYVLRSFLLQGRVPHDAVTAEDIDAEEAAWAALGLPAATPPPAYAAGAGALQGHSSPAASQRASAPASASDSRRASAASPVAASASAHGSSTREGAGAAVQSGATGAGAAAAAAGAGAGAAAAAAAAGAAPPKGPPLPYGSLIALKSVQQPTHYYVAERGEGNTFLLALRPPDEHSPTSPAAQFVVVTEKDVVGCRSIFAHGRFLQSSSTGVLSFVNEHMDEAESWHLELAQDRKKGRLINAAHGKVVLEALVEVLT